MREEGEGRREEGRRGEEGRRKGEEEGKEGGGRGEREGEGGRNKLGVRIQNASTRLCTVQPMYGIDKPQL